MNIKFQNIHLILWLLLFINASNIFAQADSISVDSANVKPQLRFDPSQSDTLLFYFREYEKEIGKGEIASNLLVIKNYKSITIDFTISIGSPAKWKSLYNSSREYSLEPEDSIFIPVRLVPNRLLNANIRYAVNALLKSTDGSLAYNTTFFGTTKKAIKWEVTPLDGNRIYFKNNETEKDFAVNVLNTGNFDQKILMDVNSSQGDAILSDTNNSILKGKPAELFLKPNEDTTLNYKVKLTRQIRNFRTVSIVNHKPFSALEERRYSVFVNSHEANGDPIGRTSRGTKIDFIKLANERKYNPYSGPTLPLIVQANAQNLLSNSVFMSVNMRGIKRFEDNSSLRYFSQMNYSSLFYNGQQVNNLPWYVGYFTKKYEIQAGQVNGGGIGAQSTGKGLRADYYITPLMKFGGFYLRNPRLFGPLSSETFGINYEWEYLESRKLFFNASRNINIGTRINSNVLSARTNIRVLKKHNLSLIGAFSNRDNRASGTSVIQNGFLAGVNYSSQFLDNDLRTNLTANYNSRYFSGASNERILINHRTSYIISEAWQVFMVNNYLENHRYPNDVNSSQAPSLSYNYFNRLVFTKSTQSGGTIQPGLFYDVVYFFNNNLHTRGLVFRYNNYDFAKNTLFSLGTRTGYGRSYTYPELGEFFIFELTTLSRYRTFTLNTRYLYGPNSSSSLITAVETGTTPQTLRLALQNQYLFKNTKYLLQTSANYTFNNRFNNHTFNIIPDLYYFTPSGWRFNVNINYGVSSNNFRAATESLNFLRPAPTEETGPTIYHTFNIGAGVRKEFGIPIPFVEQSTLDVSFVAFYDENGNKKKDRDETVIENVIIKLDDYEIITNERGVATFLNVPFGKHAALIVPLDDIVSGWFPDLPDSIDITKKGDFLIPFTRGIKIFGNVSIDREELAADADQPFDLSNIKITATNGKEYKTLTGFDGSFELYVPNGTYTLTLDENLVNDRFQIAQNNFKVELSNDLESIYVSFMIIEKRRKVNVKKFRSKY